ncbi:dihydrofolate reductase family protein [Nocardioides aromaticivorans]|nr:dihydrofolate reductase family protein [Nocardioides aromaticivorans]
MSFRGTGGQSGMGIVTADISTTTDGFGAGPGQRLERPFGDFDEGPLHGWMFDHGDDNRAEVDAIVDAGAFVMGRNMFSPGRGAWDLAWRGWWGEDPPYHAPVFVLTHHERDPLPMEGGTTFHFVTEGLDVALDRAREAAGDRNVAIAGGASTINAVMAAGQLDELRWHVVPHVSGLSAADGHDGSRLFDGVPRTGLVPVSVRHTPHVTHLTYRRG